MALWVAPYNRRPRYDHSMHRYGFGHYQPQGLSLNQIQIAACDECRHSLPGGPPEPDMWVRVVGMSPDQMFGVLNFFATVGNCLETRIYPMQPQPTLFIRFRMRQAINALYYRNSNICVSSCAVRLYVDIVDVEQMNGMHGMHGMHGMNGMNGMNWYDRELRKRQVERGLWMNWYDRELRQRQMARGSWKNWYDREMRKRQVDCRSWKCHTKRMLQACTKKLKKYKDTFLSWACGMLIGECPIQSTTNRRSVGLRGHSSGKPLKRLGTAGLYYSSRYSYF
ncbi:uncharacterized protein LOC111082272 [Drosophila obscura]|uniref:uncharacterized protein LOC111082272 n=1 Tax=Drosophila obscura TaxID=7282 RepID=UPI001BB12BD3|nr:uncharacterized protein LOC111082272 [Drosophila obscura]